MKFMLLVPGTGHFYCGSCLRDDSLGRALRQLGHHVVVAPLYLPLVTDQPADSEQVHMGGINMYLQQKTSLARYLPRWIERLLDSPAFLRFASRLGKLTEAPDLGEMTLSMLRGEHGRQAKELEKLVEWANAGDPPDVIVLSNVMLAGIARRLGKTLDRPVVSTLQGEAPFLDALPPPYSEQSWKLLGERVADIEAFVAVSRTYAERMRAKLGLEADRVHLVYNGLDLGGFGAEPEPLAVRTPRTIGYLARMCRDKGLHTLVEAFIALKERAGVPDLRLEVAGAMLNEDRAFVRSLKNRLESSGHAGDAGFLPNLARREKLAFLGRLSVLSVPATYGESFGLYLLEAWASGVPVVQPRHAAFPEILEA
ncbi:MAG: glycosyltransferase family 4 protein, partial [Planctomycetota bacterium]